MDFLTEQQRQELREKAEALGTGSVAYFDFKHAVMDGQVVLSLLDQIEVLEKALDLAEDDINYAHATTETWIAAARKELGK